MKIKIGWVYFLGIITAMLGTLALVFGLMAFGVIDVNKGTKTEQVKTELVETNNLINLK